MGGIRRQTVWIDGFCSSFGSVSSPTVLLIQIVLPDQSCSAYYCLLWRYDVALGWVFLVILALSLILLLRFGTHTLCCERW